MTDLYGSEIERINDLISQKKQTNSESLDQYLTESQQTNVDNWKQRADEYSAKWSSMTEGGSVELATALGLEGLYTSVKKVKGLYQDVQKRKEAIKDKLNPKKKGVQDPDGFEEEEDDFQDAEEEPPETSFDERGATRITSQPEQQRDPDFANEEFETYDRDPEGDDPDFFSQMRSGEPPAPSQIITNPDGTTRLGTVAEEPSEIQPAPTRPPPARGTDPVELTDFTQPQDLVQENISGVQTEVGNYTSKAQDFIDSVKSKGSNLLNKFKGTASELTATSEDLAKTSVKDVVGASTGELTETGAELGVEVGMATTDAVVGAIPVIGEAALAVTGLVSIGEGLYHLFHHKATTPKPADLPSINLNSGNAGDALTKGYSNALPSLDSAAEMSASAISF